LATLTWIARVYLWRRLLSWLPGGKRVSIFSINLMRARHPAWFKQDLEQLFGLLAAGAIRPRIAKRISFDEVAEAHRRLEAGSLDGRLVLCPNFPSDPSGVGRGRGLVQRSPLSAYSFAFPPHSLVLTRSSNCSSTASVRLFGSILLLSFGQLLFLELQPKSRTTAERYRVCDAHYTDRY